MGPSFNQDIEVQIASCCSQISFKHHVRVVVLPALPLPSHLVVSWHKSVDAVRGGTFRQQLGKGPRYHWAGKKHYNGNYQPAVYN
jgi:hypothetical protein